MFGKRNEPITIKTEKSFLNQILIFSALFIVTALGVYFCFLVCGRSLFRNSVGNIDGIAQIYPTYVSIKHMLQGLLSGEGFDSWSWSLGLGADYFDYFKGRLVNPITYLIVAFPEKYMAIAYNIMTVFRQYLAGVAFMFFAREVSLKPNTRIVGAICYAFSGWAFTATITQDTFLNALIFFPVLLLGVEWILKGRSPLVFIIAVFAFLSSSVIWAYIAGIVVILYFVVRYWLSGYEKNVAAFFKKFGTFMGYGVIGVMVSACFVVSTLYSMFSVSTDTNIDSYGFMYSLRTYLEMPVGLFRYTQIHTPYSFIYFPVICVLVIPFIITAIRKKSTPAIFTVVLFVAGLFPVVGRFFNGMGYSAGRWYFILAFFSVWAAMECIDRGVFKTKKNIKIMAVWMAVLAAWCLGGCYFVFEIMSLESAATVAVGLIAGTVILALYYIKEFKCKEGKLLCFEKKNLVSLLIVFVMMGGVIGAANIKVFPLWSDFMYRFSMTKNVPIMLDESTQKAAVKLQEEDDEFFRTDHVDGYNDTRITRTVVNENIVFDTRSVYSYFSNINAKWHEFNKAVGNNSGYYARNIVFSNDNRAGLDTLLGVKYFLGDSETKKPGASDYAPYGYNYCKTIDGVDVLKAKYSINLGTSYDKYITESELYEYDPLEREQVLLQAAVIPDDKVDMAEGISHASADDIDTETEEIEYSVNGEDNMDVEDGKLTVYKGGGSFNINIPEVKDRQIVIAFENLKREDCSYAEKRLLSGSSEETVRINSLPEYIDDISYEDDKMFKIYVKKDKVEKAARNNDGSNQGFDGIVDYNINLGYYDSISGDINVGIDNLGHYTYDSIKVYAVPMDIYDDAAQKLEADKYDIESFSDTHVIGTMDVKEASIMYFSILSTPGWKIYVDGEEVEKINDVNIAFTGAAISQGHHNVELKYTYPGLKLGLCITVIGVICLIGILVCRRRRQTL